MIDKAKLKEEAAEYNIILTEEQLEKFALYGEFLKEYNEFVNLTAITDDEGIRIKHFLDSILLFDAVGGGGKTIADVGSGAGFPGVPYKIVNPDCSLYCIEPTGKRVEFLKKLSEKLGIEINAVNIRAEDAARKPELREQFDIVTARAVKEMRELSELCLPLVKVGGVFAPLKGPDAPEEMASAKNALRLLSGEKTAIKEYVLPDESKRNIVLIKKISQSSAKYPRIYSKIKKNPL